MSTVYIFEELEQSVAWERFPRELPFESALQGAAANEVMHKRDFMCYSAAEHILNEAGEITGMLKSTWACVPNNGDPRIVLDSTGWDHSDRYSKLAEKLEEITGRTDLIIIIP